MSWMCSLMKVEQFLSTLRGKGKGFWFLTLLLVGSYGSGLAQSESWLFLLAQDTTVAPQFDKVKDQMIYTGSDIKLKEILDRYKIRRFKKTYRNAKKEHLEKTFFVQANSDSLLTELLTKSSHLFVSGYVVPMEQRKIFEPNDYGLTSTIGDNLGLQANLDYLDFLGAPKAWYYTTGTADVIIGISDGLVDTTLIEFKDKTEGLRKAYLVKGHGISVGANAAAQGDNAHGIPGVCYDCRMFSTSYGEFKTFDMLQEMVDRGSRVINCSWKGRRYYQSAQDAVYRMFDQGTIIVAAAGNNHWHKAEKGKELHYPASYDKVISVSSGMYKHKKPEDNLLIDKKGRPYVHNILGYVGRTAGFQDHDTLKPLKIYPVSVANLNKEVDILAPTVGIVRYGEMAIKDSLTYSINESTSGGTPLVTGTIGLMFSLNPCLPTDEVESILKMTSLNIDHIEANRPFRGNYGSGILQTGDAVEMVFKLYREDEVAYVRNQNFSRWDFKLTALSKEVIMENQKFTDSATLSLKAKHRIVLKPGTHLKPGGAGYTKLEIDPKLAKQCDLVFRDPSLFER